MSFLGTVLELDEGSRLTGVGLQPLARELDSRAGTVYLHVVPLPWGDDATTASGAAATFMPATLATIGGNQPDGSTWFATFQIAPDDRDSVWVERTADAAILRALNLIGVEDENVWGQALTADALQSVFRDAGTGDVSDWSISDLLTGLLIEVTNTSLTTVVANSSKPALPEEDAAELRRARLHDLLHSWAATYEGPTA